MPMKGQRPAQTFPEMVEDGKAKRAESKLYRAQSVKLTNERVSALVNRTAQELAEAATAEPLALRDIEEVKRRTILYLKACQEASVFPSMAGLARSFGMNRRSLYHCIEMKGPAPAAEWLELCRDSFSDILGEASLRNDCNSIAAIFLQKALYGLREQTELVVTPGADERFGVQKSAEQIEAEYAALPELD